MYFSLYRCSSWMQTPQQQSHSCDFTNWKIHEPEEATKTICHLSRPISNTFVGNIYQLLCLCDIPWLMYCRFLQIKHCIEMLDIYHCLTHVRCLAVCGICWPCTHPMHWVLDKTCRWCENLYLYRQPSVWFKDVFYLHSVHFVPYCSLHLCWELLYAA